MSTSLFLSAIEVETRSATVLVDEHKARGLRGGSKQSSDLGGKRLGSFCKNVAAGPYRFCFSGFRKRTPGPLIVFVDELHAGTLASIWTVWFVSRAAHPHRRRSPV
jgi:hypothetical protein